MTAINGSGADTAQAIAVQEDRASVAVAGYTASSDHTFAAPMKAPGKDRFISFLLGFEINA